MASKRQKEKLVTLEDPTSSLAEEYRTLRTNIQFASVVHETRTILVTSSAPGEGKSTTACNLAVVSAQSEKRVLLVDADLRRPNIHRRFQVTNIHGLTSLLIRERSLDDCILASGVERLSILPCGPLPPNPSELASSRAMVDLMHELRERFDLVVIDSPPVLSVSDTLALSRAADGVLFVIDSQKSHRNHVKRAVQTLQQVDAHLLGVVLNRVKRSRTDAYYYYYRYYQTSSQQPIATP
ncbi:CpsD/CapB family tyrosine-protein kinase [Alicyclobacillus fructus]|uniref:CpsD/CapB family tyrosine-protein kinase n=1 Tax=Alicyclobacillus fructus TaxID=2816082 RepID=UPI001F34FD95|nr:CpsD/CapB family tyrosine-protein kinase [Alicyclobacillus fructus]